MLTNKASSLIKAYPSDLEDNLIKECIHFKSQISSIKNTKRSNNLTIKYFKIHTRALFAKHLP